MALLGFITVHDQKWLPSENPRKTGYLQFHSEHEKANSASAAESGAEGWMEGGMQTGTLTRRRGRYATNRAGRHERSTK